ncbi:MAG: hypothetical protein AB1374_11905 [Bacillota bacterium]
MTNKKHPLEAEFGLTKEELLDAINRRFRARVTLEGAVAEVHLGKHIRALYEKGIITRYEEHDQDGYPDYSIWVSSLPEKAFRIECKNVRDKDEAYKKDGEIVAFKVETQKTRASKSDRSSRFYGYDQFEILAICLGKKTHDWRQFMYIQSKDLAPHPEYQNKMAVMHRVPLPTSDIKSPWYSSLESILEALQ